MTIRGAVKRRRSIHIHPGNVTLDIWSGLQVIDGGGLFAPGIVTAEYTATRVALTIIEPAQ